MKYLFFDIECANCFNGKGKICSFGYCVTDEDFNIIQSEDIVINPKDKFNLGTPQKEIIKLAYSKEEFFAAPDFSYFYQKIRDLLTQEDILLFGHAVFNDIMFLKSEFVRYKLEEFDIKAYDTQALFKQIKNDQKVSGLDRLCVLYNIEIENLHRSDCDAIYTMKLLQSMCNERRESVQELLTEFPNSYVELKNGSITKSFESLSNSKKLQNLSINYTEKKGISVLRGQRYSFDNEIEDDYDLAKIYVKIMAEERAACTAKVNNAQFYVYRNLESAKSLKAKKILNRVSQTGKVQRRIVFVSEEKFRTHFNIDDETIKKYIEEEKK